MATILVVDDDAAVLKAVGAALREHGHYILFADNGERAFQLACARLPDVIVSDRDMPRMDGVRLCEELGRYPASAQIPVIMTSGEVWTGPLPALWAMYFRKPVNPVVLESAIESLVVQRYWRDPGPGSLPDRATSRLAPVHKKDWF
ncbi:MAG: response regulator [Pseudomonadota bacterium]